MGNDDLGDGYRYRGRGFIQLTGEDNYRVYGAALGLDLVGHPDMAANLHNAPRIAVSYWQRAVPPAARDDVTAATRAINGGWNGLDDRRNRVEAWHAQLTPEFMADLAAGRIQPAPGAGPAVVRQAAMADGILRRSGTGPEVRELQSDLRALGIHDDRNRELRVDGNYGLATERAVRRFQEQHELAVTGRAGPETLTAIQAALQQRDQSLQPVQPVVPNVPAPRVPEPQPDQSQREDRPQGVAAEYSSVMREQALNADGQLNQAQKSPLLSEKTHPDHPLYNQAVAKLEQLGPQAFANRQQLENAAGSLVFEAKVSGMQRVDVVIQSRDGTGLFAVQGNPNDPASRRIYTDKSAATERSLEQSSNSLLQDFQGQHQEQQRTQARVV